MEFQRPLGSRFQSGHLSGVRVPPFEELRLEQWREALAIVPCLHVSPVIGVLERAVGGGHEPLSDLNQQVPQGRSDHFQVILVTKKKALEEELAPTVVRPQKKAAVPSREVIWALEEGAALGGPPGAPGPAPQRRQPLVESAMNSWMLSFWALPASRWAAVLVSMTYNMSARRNSGPPPTPLNSRPGRLRWHGQLGSERNQSRPKYSFSGAPWYLQFVSTVRKLSTLKAFEGMDNLLPTISKDFAGLIPRPSGGDRALRWLKDALRRRRVAQEHVTPLTWHSFRVFIPDCAFQLGSPLGTAVLSCHLKQNLRIALSITFR